MTRPRCLMVLMGALVCCLAGPWVHAASPALNNIFPAAGQRGQAVEVTLAGERIGDATRVLLHTRGITAQGLVAQKNNRATVTFRIAPDAPLGEHQVRLLTETGVTAMRTFHVVDKPVVNERQEKDRKASSTSLADPQPIGLGQVVLGRTHEEDVDYYGVELKKGQRLSVQVDGMRLGRGFTDPHLSVIDRRGNELAACDDTPLLGQDPYLGLIAPEDGRYVIAVRDSGYAGGNNNWYLLHVGSFVRPSVVFPLGAEPGETVDFRFSGDVRGAFRQRITLPDTVDNAYALLPETGSTRPPSGLPIRVNRLANIYEAEHPANNSFKQAGQAPVYRPPVALNGIIEKAGDHDYFRLSLTKGQALRIRCYAGSMGSALDPVINVYRASDNKHVQGNDDAPDSDDSVLAFKAPDDGEYFIRVRDHRLRGGEGFVYRLEIQPQTPSLSTSIERYDRNNPQLRQAVAVPRGGRVAALVRVDRRSVDGGLTPSFKGLPAGVSASGYAPKGQGLMPVVFEAGDTAELGASLADLGAKRPAASDGAEAIRGAFRQQTPLVTADPNRTEYHHTTLNTMPVAVTRAAPVRVDVVEPKAPVVRGGVAKLKVSVQRGSFDRRVRLHMLWRPPGVGGAGQVDFNKDQAQGHYPIDVSDNAEPRDWPMALHGYADTADGQVWVSSQLFTLRVQEPFVTGKVSKASCTTGQAVDVTVNLEHPRAWQGSGQLRLLGLPAGCQAQPVTIQPGQAQAVLTVQSAVDSPVGRHGSLMCELTIQVNGEPVVHRFGRGGQLRLDRPSKKLANAQATKQANKE